MIKNERSSRRAKDKTGMSVFLQTRPAHSQIIRDQFRDISLLLSVKKFSTCHQSINQSIIFSKKSVEIPKAIDLEKELEIPSEKKHSAF